MKVPEYYMTLLQELSEGTRKPPEGISLSQQEPLPRAIELQQQIQGMGCRSSSAAVPRRTEPSWTRTSWRP